MLKRREPPVQWTASQSGIRHGYRGRRRTTLCGIRVDERWTMPDMPRCAVCVAIAEGPVPCRP